MIRQVADVADWMTLTPNRARTWQRYAVMYDVTKAKQRLTFAPRVTLHEGLAEMVQVFMDGDLA
jgi:nucleoside-diphosphate-sugar epimerase